jgi:outer membrane protein assembly factor BamB
MSLMNERLLFVGVKGTVLALDRATGEEVWRTPLKGSDFVNLQLDGGDLLASARGEVFCLDPATGAVRWNNPLRGLGWGLVSFAGAPAIGPAEVERRRQQAATTSAASTSS